MIKRRGAPFLVMSARIVSIQSLPKESGSMIRSDQIRSSDFRFRVRFSEH